MFFFIKKIFKKSLKNIIKSAKQKTMHGFMFKKPAILMGYIGGTALACFLCLLKYCIIGVTFAKKTP